MPASGYTDHGRCARLTDWRAAVGLTGRAVGEEPVPDDGGEGSEEEGSEEEWEEDAEEEWEEDAEEEWEEEESDEWGGDAEGGDASWNATEAGGWDDADGDWEGQPPGDNAAAPAQNSRNWGAGCWIENRSGSWRWVVDFAPPAASAVPDAEDPAPEVATVAASHLVSAAVQAVLAAGAAPAAPAAASAPSVSERVRILELQLELEQLKRQRLA